MQLSIEDVKQFFHIHQALMFFVGRRLRVLDKKITSPKEYASLSPNARMEVHQSLLEHMDKIDAFAEENPAKLDETDLEIVRSWKHLVTGTFYAFRPLQEHMIFLSATDPVVAYGVVALFSPFETLIQPPLPRMLKTTLLPFKGRIVYDGLMTGHNITFGPGIRRRLNEDYKVAKAWPGVVTSLPVGREPIPATAEAPKKPTAKRAGPKKAPKPANLAHDRIVALLDAFCRDHLDEEYATLGRKMAGILARKRPSPIERGKPESWASGIVRVIGGVNFLGDPSQPHSMKMTDIDAAFDVSEAIGSAKATAIRKLLKLQGFDSEWTVPSMMEKNPMI
jgi:hypothetical protein